MPDDEIAREAWRREASHHPGHRNFRPHLRPQGANLIGMRGEQAFVLWAKRGKVDLTPRPGGDGGKDQWVRIGGKFYRLDCKTALIPKDLIVEVDACRPKTIYVLCKYFKEDDRAVCLGWQVGSVLMESKPKDYGKGVINYWCPRSTLRTMEELKELCDEG